MKAVLKGIQQGLITIALSFAIALITLFGIDHIQETKAIPLVNIPTDYKLAQVNYTRTDLDNPTAIKDQTSNKHLIDNSRAKLKENVEETRQNLNGDNFNPPEANNLFEEIQEKVSDIFGGKEKPARDRPHSRVEK